MQPIVNGLKAEYDVHVEFINFNALDGADGKEFFEQVGLPGHPGIVIYSADGQQVYRAVGIVDVQQLRQQIEAALVDG